MSIPFTFGFDVAHLASLLEPASKPERSLLDVDDDVASSASVSGDPLAAEAAHILVLFRARNDVAEIVRELWPDVKAGSTYQKRSAEVQATLRTVL